MSAEFWWTVASTLALVIFNAGVVYKMIKDKPSEERVSEMIDERFANHCPYSSKITELETEKKDAASYRERLATDLLKENAKTNLTLQRIELNLKRVCNKITVEYLE